MDFDERPDTDRGRENRSKLFELRVSGLDNFSMAVETDDLRGAGERTKHQDDPFVLFHVRDGLYAAASEVQIDHRSFIDDSEGVAIFGRTIHVTFLRKRRRCHEKDLLRRKPPSHFFV